MTSSVDGQGTTTAARTEDRRVASGGAALITALVAALALLDAAMETFRGGGAFRWWLPAAAIVSVALGAWLFAVGRSRGRGGVAGAAGVLLTGLVALLAVSAWLPGGQTDGVRMFGQTTPTVLTGSLAAAVILAIYVIVRRVDFLPSTARLVVRLVVVLLGLYALAALGLALKDRFAFAALFQGGGLWQRLPRWLQGAFVGALGLVPVAILAQVVRFFTFLRGQHPVRIILHQTTALVMAVVMALSGLNLPAGGSLATTAPGSAAAGSVPGVGPMGGPGARQPVTPERIDRVFKAIETATRDIPADTFDVRAIVATVGKDPVKLFEWTRDNTYWVAYRGALRGASGVLMDRLGNSLDRSLLLAELLRAAGYQVQLAHASLSEQQAGELAAALKAPPAQPLPRPAALTPQQAADAAVRYAAELQVDSGRVRAYVQQGILDSQRVAQDVAQRVGVQVPFLANVVGNPVPAADTRARTVAALADHWWVQWLDGSTWADLDPMAGAPRQAIPGVVAAQRFPMRAAGKKIALGREFCQEVVLRVVVEQWTGGRVNEKTAMSYTFRPAEVFGDAIAVGHVPIDAPKDMKFLREKDGWKTRASAQTEWLPYVSVGGRNLFEASFTATGEINRNPKIGTPRGLGPGGGMMDMFGGGLSGGEGPAADGVLTAEWIEYEIRVPGENPVKVRRDIFDLLGHRARSANPVPAPAKDERPLRQRAFGMAGIVEVLPQICRLTPEFVVRQYLAGATLNQAALSGFVTRTAAGDIDGSLDQARRMKPTADRLYDLALARFEWSARAQDVYIASPNILSFRTAVFEETDGQIVARYGFDIVTNDVELRSPAQTDAFRVRLAQGTADTNAEGVLAGQATIRNAAILLGGTPGRDRSWLALHGPGDQAVPQLGWADPVRGLIEKDLAAGYVVVAPKLQSASEDLSRCAWWRIDPRTGQTLGTGPSGWGEAAEKSLLDTAMMSVSIFVISFMVIFTGCLARKAAFGPHGQEAAVAALLDCGCAGLAGGASIAAGWAVGAPAKGLAIAAGVKELLCG